MGRSPQTRRTGKAPGRGWCTRPGPWATACTGRHGADGKTGRVRTPQIRAARCCGTGGSTCPVRTGTRRRCTTAHQWKYPPHARTRRTQGPARRTAHGPRTTKGRNGKGPGLQGRMEAKGWRRPAETMGAEERCQRMEGAGPRRPAPLQQGGAQQPLQPAQPCQRRIGAPQQILGAGRCGQPPRGR